MSMEQYIFRIIIQSQEQITNPRFNISVKPINYQLKLLNYRRELILLLRELKQIVEDIQKFATSFDQFSFTQSLIAFQGTQSTPINQIWNNI